MTRLIGFNGSMGSGKSTAIKELEQYLQSPVLLVKFAQPLYDMQEYIYERISSVVKRDASFVKDRKLLQWIGTEWGRDTISKTLWADIWEAEVRKGLSQGHVVVCDDVRFDNEAERMKQMGGKVIHIYCNRTHERIDTSAGLPNHQSEAGINFDFVDAIVPNNKTLQDYKDSLALAFSTLGVGESDQTAG